MRISKQIRYSLSESGIFADVEIRKIESNPILNHRPISGFLKSTGGSAEYEKAFFSENQEIQELSKSISEIGLLHPIVVRPKGEHFEIVSGNRRLAACIELGWKSIHCHIIELSDREAYETSLTENVQRRTLEPTEEANAFKRYVIEFGWGGITDLAQKIGKSPSYVEKRLKILQLPSEVIESLAKNKINPATAAELALVKDVQAQSQLGKLIEERKLSSRKVRQIVKKYNTDNQLIISHNGNPSESIYDYSDATSDEVKERYLTLIKQNSCDIEYLDRKTKRTFDKAIVVLRVAITKLAEVIQSSEENWIVYEILMQHKRFLNNQIDILLKEKKKI